MKKYKTDLHCHTRGSCPCATESLEQTADKYIRCGYTTIVTTNHFHAFHMKKLFDGSLNDYVDAVFSSDRELRRIADGRLNILTGVELSLDAEYTPDTEYLVFGITPEILKGLPNIFTLRDRDVYKYFNENCCLFVQAHPMRFNMRTVDPQYVDGYEVVNSYPRFDSHNKIARAWAELVGGKDVIMTAGTDNHHAQHDPTAGIMTDFPITTNEELLAVLRSGKYEIFGE